MSLKGSARADFYAALLLCLTAAAWAQDSKGQNSAQNSAVAVAAASSSVYSADASSAGSFGDPTLVDPSLAGAASLADVARQTREQHASENVEKTQAAAERDGDEPTTFQACDDVLCPSGQLTEDVVIPPPMRSEQSIPKLVSTAGLQDASAIADDSDGPSLAEVARQTRQSLRSQAQAKPESGDAVPEGFQSLLIQYCLNPQICSEGTVLIPENAEVVSRVNSQYVFKLALNDTGEVAMLYAGPADVNAPYRSMTDPDFIRMRDLASASGGSHEKTDGASTQNLDLEGKRAVIARFRYQREEKQWWIGERALIKMAGAYFLVACTAPEESFTALEAPCTVLMNSLRVH